MALGISGGQAAGRAPTISVSSLLRAVIFCISITGAWLSCVPTAYAQQLTITRVNIEGNTRVGDAAILSRAGIVPGETLTEGQLNAGLQRLVASGLFESVDFEPRGNTLNITVVEYPTINRINFEGNRRIDDETLAAAINSNERRVFSPAQAERDAAIIAEAYASEGRIAARVTPTIIRRSDNRVDLIFEIFEGDNIEIERISFTGNRVFSDRRLRGVLETKQAGLFRAFVRSDTLIADRLEFDRQLLRDFYLSRGYIDFQTNSVNAELTEERDAYFVVFDVQEGQQFRIGEVTVVSELADADEEVYAGVAKIKTGKVYSPTLIENDIARMERKAIADGVDFLRVEPRITRDERNLAINVEYVLSRGPRVFVERIDIEGNTTTLDRVIRRQFDSVEGDPFNPREIRESAERIRALGFFANAEVDAREGSAPDQVIVDVNVEEQPTGSLSFGASFSTNDGIGFAIRFRERNFLGRGQNLGLSVSTASRDRFYQFDFTEPAFLGRDVAYGINIDVSQRNSSTFSFDTSRALLRNALTFPVGVNSRLTLSHSFDQTKMKNPSSDTGPIIRREIDEGKRLNSLVGYQFSYDTRRAGLDPTSGYLIEFGQEFAGV